MKYLYLTSLLLCLFPMRVPATEVERLDIILKNASKTYDVPYRLLVAVGIVESRLNPQALNASDGGSASYGAFQLKMNTARMLGFHGTKQNLMDFHTNTKYAAMYLSYQLKRYHGSWMKAARAFNQGSYDGLFWSDYNQRIVYALATL